MGRNEKTIALIKQYQKNKKVYGRCHFIPTCSNYAIEAYQKFNWFYASILTGFRILRCNPLARKRVDPVPLNKEEKRKKKMVSDLRQNFDTIYIDTILKQKPLSKEEYIKLTKEYLFGEHQNNKNNNYNTIEFIGLNYVRTSFYKEYTNKIDNNKLNEYLNILDILSNNKIINYEQNSNSTNYNVVKTIDLPVEYYFKEIEKYFTDTTIIGIDGSIPEQLIDKYQATIIDSKELNHKFIHQNNNKIVFVTGNDITSPKKSFYFNCLIKIYQENEIFDIKKYNLIIPFEKFN